MSAKNQVLEAIQSLNPDDRAAVLLELAPSPPSSTTSNQESTLPPATPTMTFPPRLSVFSGEPDKDVRYTQWKAEILGLQNHPESTVLQAMRRSVKSLAADVLLHLPSKATVKETLAKFDQMFGCVQPAEQMYERFYTARQIATESAVAWACRLENIISDIQAADEKLPPDTATNMLRSKFWSGLCSPAARDALRHKFDDQASFPELLVAARQFEDEGKKSAASASAIHGSTASTELSEVMKLLLTLNKKVEDLDRRTQQRPTASGFNGRCYNCKERGHRQADCRKTGNE